MNKDSACKTPRWLALKAKLNNLDPRNFKEGVEKDKNAILIDVRTEAEFAGGHIEGAKNINYFAEDFWDKIEKLDANKSYYVYCRSGRRSIRTCTLMRNGGFTKEKIFNLDGGIKQWLSEGLLLS